MSRTPARRSILGELKRRHVFKVGAAYVVVAFVVMEAAGMFTDYLQLPAFTPRLVTALLFLGLPIALVLAWAYEITDRGVVRDSEVESTTATRVSPAPLDPSEVRPRSVAVLPFANLSGEEDSEYFSDGVTDDIITSVSRIAELTVVSWTSVMRYKQSDEPVREIARALRVGTVLEGSVRRAGGRVRISAQLIDAIQDRHIWVESYDHRLEDIFEIQSDVATRIAEALATELSPEERADIDRRPTVEVEAYDQYLKGRFLWSRRTEDGLLKSIDYYGRSLEMDENFALAEAGLADSYVTLGLYGVSDPREVMPLAREAATRSLAIDPRAAEALTSLATVRGLYDWSWSEAERDYRHAIELQPNYPVAHHWYASNLLTPLGRFDEARVELKKALELDPLSEAVATSVGVVCLYSGDCDSAVQRFDELLDVHQHFGMAHFFKGLAHAGLEQWPEAIACLGRADEFTGSSIEVRAAQGHALASSGREAAAREILVELKTRCDEHYCSPALRAQVHLGLGEKEEALDLLEQGADERAVDLVWMHVRPTYDPLRGHPRFEALLKRVGLPASSTT